MNSIFPTLTLFRLISRKFSFLFYLLFPLISYAHNISITATTPFPSTISTSSSATAIFSVRNMTSNVPLIAIDQTQFPSGSGLTIISNSCGSLMQPGQSCAITVALLAPAKPQVLSAELKEWAKPSADAVKFPFSINIVSSPSFQTLVAAGQSSIGSLPPLLALSTNNGMNWEEKLISGLPTIGFFNATNCTGSGISAICVAGGRDLTGTQPALLSVSSDGGNTWSVKNYVGSPPSGAFRDISCTGNGSNAICVAAGVDYNSTFIYSPLLTVSTDGGNTWTAKSVTSLPAYSVFNSASCVGSGTNAICVLAGMDGNAGIPYLSVSTDGGNNWALKPVTNLPVSGALTGASCTGTGSTAICIAVGVSRIGSQPPLLAASTDGAVTWGTKVISGLPATGYFNSASCTGSSNAICIAAGQDLTGSSPPLLAVSTDDSATWAVTSIPGLPASGYFNRASCVGSGLSAICIAVGFNSTGTQPPLLVISTNGGMTWSVPTISGLPANGEFYSASCTYNGSNTVCFAVGQDYTSGQPLVAVSPDDGMTWSINTSFTPGTFNGASGHA